MQDMPKTAKEALFYNTLKDAFSLLTPISTVLERRILLDVDIKSYPRKFHLEIPGEITNCIFVILRGIARSYIVTNENKEITVRLLIEGSIINLEADTMNLSPSRIFTELLTHSVIGQIHLDKFSNIYREFAEAASLKANAIKRIANEKAIQEEIKQLTSVHSRLSCFMEKCPGFINRLPGKYIAAYIGVAPETLSRARKLNAVKAKNNKK